MSPSWRYSGFALILVLLACHAQARDLGPDEALRLRNKGIIQPLETVMQSVLGLYPGAVLLETELEREDDLLVYEVELLTVDGTVRELELDARNGHILKDELED